ncbi:MAG: hypothetical protein COA42_14365 [Alteromonadaceae bacterium]|nr:MAG: hypothetical protein COA42_14365 [Alteromonadaceae bacterium]
MGQVLDKLITDGGRELDATVVEEKLQQFYKFETHFGPPLSFVANRKIGVNGVMVMDVRGGKPEVDGAYAWLAF